MVIPSPSLGKQKDALLSMYPGGLDTGQPSFLLLISSTLNCTGLDVGSNARKYSTFFC